MRVAVISPSPSRIAVLAMTALAVSLQAAPITWQGAVNTTGKAQLVEGNVVLALDFGTESPSVTGGGSGGTGTCSFSAANFTSGSISFTPTGVDAGDTPTVGTLPTGTIYNGLTFVSTGDTNFDAVIGTLAYTKGTPTGIQNGTMTFSGLTPGENYKIQFFYNDQRNDKSLTLGDGLGNSVTIASGATTGSQGDDYGQHAVGTFTASGTSQQVILQSTAGNIHLNAILLVYAGTAPFPDVPTGLKCTPGNGMVSLAWDVNTQVGFGHFVVKRGTTAAGPFTPLAGATPTVSHYIDGTAANGTTYYYVVSAVNNLGQESTNTAPVSATPFASIQRPNILVLYLDDQNTDYNCYGNTLTHTPNMDRLATEGRMFTRAHVVNPICSPSHTALFTGNYPTTLGCPHHRSNYIPELPPGHGSLPKLLEDAGYFTVNISNGQIIYGASGKTDLNFNRDEDPFTYTQDFEYTDLTTYFQGGVWTNRQPSQPFFAYVNIETGKAHGFAAGTTWATANGYAVPTNAVSIPPYLADIPEWRTRIAQYLNAVSHTDYVVGHFLDALDLGGEANNTLVILATDHGRATMRHKQWLYETGLNVPLLMRWPNHIAPGTVVSNLVSIIDIAPTCLAAAGVPAPEKIEGLDLLSADLSRRTHLFAARDGADGVFDRSRAVIGQRYKYIRHFYPEIPYINGSYADNTLSSPGMLTMLENGELTPEQAYYLLDHKVKEELYDLSVDPWEVHNLATNAADHAFLEEHRELLSDWMRQTGDYAPDAHVTLGNIAPNTSVQTLLNAYSDLLRDADGDGINDYYEYLLNLNTNVPDAQLASSYSLEPNGDINFQVRNLRNGYRYTVETSTNLQSWHSFTNLDGVSGGTPTGVIVPRSLAEPSGALFMRLFIPQ